MMDLTFIRSISWITLVGIFKCVSFEFDSHSFNTLCKSRCDLYCKTRFTKMTVKMFITKNIWQINVIYRPTKCFTNLKFISLHAGLNIWSNIRWSFIPTHAYRFTFFISCANLPIFWVSPALCSKRPKLIFHADHSCPAILINIAKLCLFKSSASQLMTILVETILIIRTVIPWKSVSFQRFK